MTNPKTPAEVNEALALREGWTKHLFGNLVGWLPPGIVRGPGCLDHVKEHPPDFCGKWEHAGPKFDEMRKDIGNEMAWYLAGEVFRKNPSMPLTEAIARASLAWKQDSREEV